jgi:hypothetical protein
MEYGKIFSRAWNICWNHKFLFLLGFLAILGAGGNSSGSNFNYNFDQQDLPFAPNGTVSPEFAQNMERLLTAAIPIFIGLACAGVFIGIALWLIRLTAQAGMIKAAAEIDGGQKMSFGQAFSAGLKYLPRFMGLNLVLYLPLILLVIVAMLGVFMSFGAAIAAAIAGSSTDSVNSGLGAGFGIVALCMAALACLAIPLGLLITLLYPFAMRSAVLEEQGVIDSVRRGWRMLSQNIGETLVLILLYFGIGLAVGFVITLIMLPFLAIFALPTVFDVLAEQTLDTGNLLILIAGTAVMGIIGAVVQSIWTTFRSVSFTLAYKEFMLKTVK